MSFFRRTRSLKPSSDFKVPDLTTLDPNKRHAQKYWRINQSLIFILLSLWALVAFGMGIWGVDTLNQYQIFGFKLGYWVANQGSVYVFCFIVCIYAWSMNKIDDAMAIRE